MAETIPWPEPQPAIYISYATGDAQETGPSREELVNRLEISLRAAGYRVKRDKNDIGYKDRISEFMAEMGQADCIVVVISEKYLQSPFCMLELHDIYQHQHFRERIFPVVLADAQISRPQQRLPYVRYWQQEFQNINSQLQGIDPAFLSSKGSLEAADQHRKIAQNVDEILAYLADVHSKTPEGLAANDFAVLKQALAARSMPAPPSDPTLQQRQDAFVQHVRQAIGIVLARPRLQPLSAQLRQAAHANVALPEDILLPLQNAWSVEDAIDTLHRATQACLHSAAGPQPHASAELTAGATEVLGWLALLAVSDTWVQQWNAEPAPAVHFQQLLGAESITLGVETAAGTEIVEARLRQRQAVFRLRDDGFTLYSPQQMATGDLEVGLHVHDAYDQIERLLWKRVFKTEAPRPLSPFQQDDLKNTLEIRYRRGESYHFLLQGQHEATMAHNTNILRTLRERLPYLGTFIIGLASGEQVLVLHEARLTPLIREFLLLVRGATA